MGLFDNSLLNQFIPSIFKPDNQGLGNMEAMKWIRQQQCGCGVRIYPSNPGRAPITLFWEILQANVDTDTTNIEGAVNITLTGSAPWDELIQPDDYIRVFMGDQIATTNVPPGAFNFASNVKTGSANSNQRGDIVALPIPNTGYSVSGTSQVQMGDSQRPRFSYLIMYEKFFGRVDRVLRVEQAGGQGAGTNVTFNLAGRLFSSILPDMSLYYNEWIAGLNAINVFWQTIPDFFTSPTEIVKQMLAILLTEVPMPQFQLPPSLVQDMQIPTIAQANTAFADTLLRDFRQRIAKAQQNLTFQTDNALARLNSIVTSREQSGPTNPLSIISLNSFFDTYGKSLNKSFLSSQNNGAYDLIKTLSNPIFNEFFFDMCPQGRVDGGTLSDSRGIPTFVMRQRPYDITPEMLDDRILFDRLTDQAKKLEDFGAPSISGKISSSLYSNIQSSISIFGYAQTSDVNQFFEGLQNVPQFLKPDGYYNPTIMNYQCGYSGHDRLNAWLCLGAYNRGQATQTDRITASVNGSLLIDKDSILKYGFRIMEVSSPYVQPYDNKDSVTETIPTLIKNFSGLLANWYFMNPYFLNGRISCSFLPNARLGIPVKVYQPRSMPTNPYPKIELYYCQGVSHSFTQGQPLSTTLTLTRGIRYTFSNKGVKTSDNYGLERAKAAFGGLV